MLKKDIKKILARRPEERIAELVDLIHSISEYSDNMPHSLRDAIKDVIEVSNFEIYGANNIREIT